MTSSTFIDLRINNAEQFKEAVSEPSPNTKLYLVYGKTDAWANDAAPSVSNSSVSTTYEIWDNMIGGKRILGGDMSHVVPRYNWTTGTTYDAYDDKRDDLYDTNTKFFVMNADYSVYKCISNNNGMTSTTQPTSVNPNIITATSDGYVWKYMYTISDTEKLRFITDSYIPVKTLSQDDGSLQWQVQDLSISGSIDNIVVTSGGSNYTNVSNVSISITGDGTLATAIATLNTTSNTVSSITISSRGLNYSYATATITDAGTGTGATARVIISPPGGHGSDPLYELGGKNVLIDTKIKYDEEGTLPANNDFRQISLLKDPFVYNTTNVASNIAFTQAMTLVCDGVGNYSEDEIVYQGATLATASFKGRVVSWNPTTSKIILINTVGTPTLSQSIIGTTSLVSRVVTSQINGLLQRHSGRLLYVDNIKPITRSLDQIEDFQILLKF